VVVGEVWMTPKILQVFMKRCIEEEPGTKGNCRVVGKHTIFTLFEHNGSKRKEKSDCYKILPVCRK
jgi:hypothetical protein